MTEDEIRSILSKIRYPGYAKSIVDFKIVKSIEISGDEVKILLNLATKNEDVRNRVLEEIKSAFKGSGIRLILTTVQDQPTSTTVEQKHFVQSAKKRIAVLSAKGGVGKTTVAVSMAISLKRKGYKVAILDADIHGPNVPRMLGTIEEKATVGENKKLIPVFKDGIYSMSLGYVVDQETPVIWKGAMVTKAIVEMMEMTDWPELDYFIIDLPPGTGDAALTVKQNLDLDGAVIVTTPGELSIADAVRTVDFFNQVGIKISGFVENMAYFVCDNCHNKLYPFGKIEFGDLEKILGLPGLGEIPFDIEVEKSADEGTLARDGNNEYFEIVDKIVDKI
ncbi:Mrp/NBP35 family ATP-binding protein [Athalassotoga saccharophila]|uniref:Mrp/NBP35 family ATP-binding protein n=1 Tax=Athalassotoga saccharophila TaxID=1441386 RepID=UPI001379E46B|nr:Mrp/NBP35 family ATP-binding protein [Athalassotoga saccharophila]BBJ28495.1 iron-sulfur cluster carrier protein [Athalassotoga saccharophila]